MSFSEVTNLLAKLSKDWKKVTTDCGHCTATLFTNRKFHEVIIRRENPPLENFWKLLRNQCSIICNIEDLNFDSEPLSIPDKKLYHTGLTKWLEELNHLSSTEQLCFLQNFEILTNQPSLQDLQEEITSKLQNIFLQIK